jgi:hypothetical protein
MAKGGDGADFGVALKRPPRLPVNVDNATVRVTREVDADFDVDLGHLLVDLRLQIPVSVHKIAASIPRAFFSGLVLLMNGFNLPEMEVTSSKKENSLW